MELKSHIQFYDGIRTADIHETIIKAAVDSSPSKARTTSTWLPVCHLPPGKIGLRPSLSRPALQYQHRRQDWRTWGTTSTCWKTTPRREFEELNGYLGSLARCHGPPTRWSSSSKVPGTEPRVTGEIHESPQLLYILVAACLFSKYPKDTRLDYIKRFYDAVSTFKISPADPDQRAACAPRPASSAPAC